MAEAPLLIIEDLVVDYLGPSGPARAVNGVSFVLERSEVLGLVGESGSGKSSIAQAIMRILAPPAVIRNGRIIFDGRDVCSMSEDELRAFRWRDVAFVPQGAMNSLCPVMTVGEQIIDVIRTHERVSAKIAHERTTELLQLVGVDPARHSSYPHELSGGMRQRIAIAIALALRPPLVIMDEPTTALDVVVQHEVLTRIAALRDELGLSILFITHDLSVVSRFSSRIGVLYAGELVELAPAHDIFRSPRHPYTKGLLSSLVSVHGPRQKLVGIPGSPPDLRRRPSGCAFRTRCPEAADRCATEVPSLRVLDEHRHAACHFVAP